ncbi:MAG: hypothetical protein ACI4JK_02060 [Oscillospiraceae bacterium]
MGIDEVLSVMKKCFGDIPCKNGGFISLPKQHHHTFAVWRISHRRADGADGYNLYWDVTYELRIFYRDTKTELDWQNEKEFEDGIRECNGLESDYEYDDSDKLDITVYKFTDTIEF